jgi:hypothetical protein
LQSEAASKSGSAGAQAAIANAAGASSAADAPKSGTAPAAAATAMASGAAPVPSAPAQKLTQTPFPDGSGSLGLPAGWKITAAREGDVSAAGPNGEVLRFGMAQAVIDPGNPQSRALGRGPGGSAPGNFVAIPYGTAPEQAFTAVLTQLAAKARKSTPVIIYTLLRKCRVKAAARTIS